jgi:hypothetical protein
MSMINNDMENRDGTPIFPYHASFFDGCGGQIVVDSRLEAGKGNPEIRVHDPKFWQIWVMSPDFPFCCLAL